MSMPHMHYALVMVSFNFDEFRNALLAQSTAKAEEKIEVNQRHLIDKILARYSAEYTVYREVIQNANDAGAHNVEIIFEEGQALSSGQVPLISSITLRNNGRPFDSNDWNRLRKIAEGNPDEQKIGFFGVGFYSLFSICEEPFVVSGKACLAFFWKGDQLYARTGLAPMDFDENWTTIYLRLREPIDRPNLDSFAHFLTKSLLFTGNLEKVTLSSGSKEVFFDIRKKLSTPTELPVNPSVLFQSLSSKPTGMFSIRQVLMQAIQIDLDKRYTSETASGDRSILSSIWSMAKKITKDRQQRQVEAAMIQPGVFSLFLHVINCKVKVNTNSSFTTAMERVTKKKPPTNLVLSLLYSTFDELQVSSGSNPIAKHPVLSGVLPEIEGGRIFIGFETHQTTGCAIHLAGPFIPTVERESLDFVDKTLSLWNEELLRIGAKVIRLVYETEMRGLLQLFPQSTTGNSDQPEAYWEKALHIIKSFGVGPSSPSLAPSHVIIDEFFSVTSRPLLLPSNVGVVALPDLRNIPPLVTAFVKSIPTLNTERLVGGDRMLGLILNHSNIQMASFAEIIQSLKGRKLADHDLVACLEWIISEQQQSRINLRAYYNMISSLVVPVGSSTLTDQYAPLSTITHYPAGRLGYESEMPMPKYCISPKISERIAGWELEGTFNLKALSLSDWVTFVAQDPFITDTANCEKFLIFLSRSFANLKDQEKAAIASILSEVPVVPTNLGSLCRPRDSYLEDAGVLGGVSIVKFTDRRSISDEFLKILGVNAHIKVAKIFAQLEKLAWDHRKLVKYMVRVQDQLSSEELQMLREAKIFPAIGRGSDRFCLSELYLDHPVVRLLKLPVLEWKGGEAPSAYSDSTRFMITLGLKAIIPWKLLLSSILPHSAKERIILLCYFIDHYNEEYRSTYVAKEIDFEFIPTIDGNLSRPSDLYADQGVALLGFKVIHPDLLSYTGVFGVQLRPPGEVLTLQIISRNFDRNQAKALFEYLSTILANFCGNNFRQLSQAKFVPVGGDEWSCPRDLFFARGRFDLGNDVFPVIDFGTSARPFLGSCGVRDEPQVENVAHSICLEPDLFLKRLGGDVYLDLLRWLALQYDQIPGPALKKLSSSKALIGVNYHVEDKSDETTPQALLIDRESIVQEQLIESRYVLAKVEELFIVDDTISQQLFNCLAVPADGTIESFYKKLGVRQLSKCVRMAWKFRGVPRGSEEVMQLQQLIQSRVPLLVAEHPTGSKLHRNAMDRLQKLEIKAADAIVISRTFEGRLHEQPTTACLQSETILLISEPYDFFDVATVLVRLIYADTTRLPDALLVSTLLSSSLSSLRAKGFPVDRILAGRHKDQEYIPPKPNTRRSTSSLPTDFPPPPTVKVQEELRITQPSDMPPKSRIATLKIPPPGESNASESRIKPSSSSSIGSLPDPQKPKNLFGIFRNVFSTGSRHHSNSNNNNNTTTTVSLPSKSEEGHPPNSIDNVGLRETLDRSIQSLQRHDKGSIDDSSQRIPVLPVPLDAQNEADSYCEIIPGHSLGFFDTVKGFPVYYTRRLEREQVQQLFLKDSQILESFTLILDRLARTFDLPIGVLHVFFDPKSRSIAFNRSRALFLNFAHYQRQLAASLSDRQLYASWYMTICHELAHNFILYQPSIFL